jgi:hypothetical protein
LLKKCSAVAFIFRRQFFFAGEILLIAQQKKLDIFMQIINERWQQTINQLSCSALEQ